MRRSFALNITDASTPHLRRIVYRGWQWLQDPSNVGHRRRSHVEHIVKDSKYVLALRQHHGDRWRGEMKRGGVA